MVDHQSKINKLTIEYESRVGAFKKSVSPLRSFLTNWLAQSNDYEPASAELKKTLLELQQAFFSFAMIMHKQKLEAFCRDQSLPLKKKIRGCIEIVDDAILEHSAYAKRIYLQESKSSRDAVSLENENNNRGNVLLAEGAKLYKGREDIGLWVPHFSEMVDGQQRLYLWEAQQVQVVSPEILSLMHPPDMDENEIKAMMAVGFEKFLGCLYIQDGIQTRQAHCWKCKRALSSDADPACPNCSNGSFEGLICRCGACLCQNVVEPERRVEFGLISKLGEAFRRRWLTESMNE